MRILYLHPGSDLNKSAYGVIPVGAFSIGSALKSEGHEFKILNFALEIFINPEFKLLNYLHQYQPELVMIELHWYVHARCAVKLARLVKQWNTNIPIVTGGITASIFAHEIIHYPEFDYIISGDGEYASARLVQELRKIPSQLDQVPNLWFKRNEQIHSPTVFHSETSLDHLHFADYQLLENWDRYMQVGKVPELKNIPGRIPDFWLCNGRGCVFQCDFCGGGKTAQASIYGRNTIVQRSVDKLCQDIEFLYQNSGVQQICLSYDLALMKKPYYLQLFRTWKTSKWSLGLYNECWQLPTKTFVEAFAKSVVLGQSALVFSPISGNESVRQKNGKYFTNQKFLELLRLMAKVQIPVQLFFNFNALDQDLEAFKQTINICQLISKFYPPALVQFYCQDVSPEPLSPRIDRVKPLTFKDYYEKKYLTFDDQLQENSHEKEQLWHNFLNNHQLIFEPVFTQYNQNIWSLS